MLSEIGFPTNGAFLNQNPINKPAMKNKIFLVAVVFHFVHPVEVEIIRR